MQMETEREVAVDSDRHCSSQREPGRSAKAVGFPMTCVQRSPLKSTMGEPHMSNSDSPVPGTRGSCTHVNVNSGRGQGGRSDDRGL